MEGILQNDSPEVKNIKNADINEIIRLCFGGVTLKKRVKHFIENIFSFIWI